MNPIKKVIKFLLLPVLPMGLFGIGSNSGKSSSDTKSIGDSTTFGPAWQQQAQQIGVGEASRLYGQGPQQYYPGQTVAGLTKQQLAAMNGIQNLATDPNTAKYIGQGYDAVSGLFQQGQQLGQQGQSAVNNYLTNNNLNDASGSLNNFMYGEQGNAALNAGKTGMGSFLGDNYNAYTSDAVQAAINPMITEFNNNILPKLRMSYGGNVGNTGQGIAEGLAANGLTAQMNDAANKIGYDSWNQNNQNKLTASNSLMSQGNNELTNRLQASNLALSDSQNKANLGLQSVNAGQQANALGLNNLSTPLNASSDLYNKLFGVGQTLQDQQQKQMNALKANWDFNQNAVWDNLSRYLQAINQNYGGTTSEQGASHTDGKTSGFGISGGI